MHQRKVNSQRQQVHKRQAVHELFPPQGTHRQVMPRSPRPQKRGREWVWGLAFLGVLVGVFGIVGWMKRSGSQAPFVLVDIRALEENGHPVTGARVWINKAPMGVTDSFGEWRRYMRLKPGERLALELAKEGEIGLQGSKQLKVPSQKNQSQAVEVKTTIELQRLAKGSKKVLAKASKPNKTVVEPELAEDPTEPRPDPDLQVLRQRQVAEANGGEDENPDTNDASMAVYFDDGLSSISVQVQSYGRTPANLLEKHQSQVVQEKIMPMLSNELQKLGLRIDRQAPWKVVLSYIPKQDQVGYIRAGISWKTPFGQVEQTAFIAGFAKTFEETSRSLSTLLRLHMKKSFWAFKDNSSWFIDEDSGTTPFWSLKPGTNLLDTNGQRFALSLHQQREKTKRWRVLVTSPQPCQNVRQRLRCLLSTPSLKDAPPMAGWRQKNMAVLGNIPAGAEVFVAGFQAQAVGDGRWAYWGHPGSNHKALVIHEGKVLHSEIFVDQAAVQTVLRVIPQPGVKQARR